MTRLELPITILLRHPLQSLNEIKGRHWSKRHNQKQPWWIAFMEAGIRDKQEPPTTKRRVTITRILGPRQREWDFENFTGGSAKSLIDVGTDLNLWKDDNPTWLEREYRQDSTRRKLGPAVELKIEETR